MTEEEFDAEGVPNTLPHMARGEFLTRLGAAMHHGYALEPESKWWISHNFNCPFVLLDEPEPCPVCGNLLALTSPRVTVLVGTDLEPCFIPVN